MESDVFTLLVTLAERELEAPPMLRVGERRVIEKSLSWLQAQMDADADED